MICTGQISWFFIRKSIWMENKNQHNNKTETIYITRQCESYAFGMCMACCEDVRQLIERKKNWSNTKCRQIRNNRKRNSTENIWVRWKLKKSKYKWYRAEVFFSQFSLIFHNFFLFCFWIRLVAFFGWLFVSNVWWVSNLIFWLQ